MTDFDYSTKSPPPALHAGVRIFVQLMAPRGMAGADYGVWPRVWARYPDRQWRVVPLQRRGRARQLAALLAAHEHGVQASDAEHLLAGGGPTTSGVSRHARDTLHETLLQEGLAELFPLNDRGGPDQAAWQLRHSTTDVAVAGAAVAAGDWRTAEHLTDAGEGFLVTFPEHGQRDHARRRLPLRRQVADDASTDVVGIALPSDLVAYARDAAEQVRLHLADATKTADEGTGPTSPPDASELTPRLLAAPRPDAGNDHDADALVVERRQIQSPFLHAAPDVSPQAIVLRVTDAGREPVLLAVVPLSALPSRLRRPPVRKTASFAAASVVAITAAVAVLALALSLSGSGADHGRRYTRHLVLAVANLDTSGAKATVEDKSPLRLATRPAVYCGLKHCLIDKTEREHGETYDGAFCQTLGERTTNGSDNSTVDDHNPQLRRTRLYYGVELSDGTTGYVSAAWLSNGDRTGHGLPSCVSVRPIPAPGRAALLVAAKAP